MATGSPGHSGGGGGGGDGGVGVAIVDVHGAVAAGREREKRGARRRSWIRMDASTGSCEVLELAQSDLMRRLDLPARDLRLLDTLLTYPPSLLSRDRAIVCSIEQIRCIIAADEAFVVNSLDQHVVTLLAKVQGRLAERAAPDDDLPFEFIVLEIALEEVSKSMDSEVSELETEAYPVVDAMRTKLSSINLERLRRLKIRMVELTRRIQRVRDTIEQLMDNDDDLAECCLTEKKRMVEASLPVEQGLQGFGHNVFDPSITVPVSPPPAPGKLVKTSSFTRSRHSHFKSSDSSQYSTEELEMLLETYLMVNDGSLDKIASMYIDDTEAYIKIQLDSTRNKLLKFELLLGTAAFVVGMFAVIPGVFGMNFEGVKLYKVRHAFEGTIGITGACSLVIFGCFMWYLKRRMSF